MLTATRRAGWRTPTYSNNGEECFDVDFTDLGIELRHSRHPSGPVLFFTRDHWGRFLDEVVSGEVTNTNDAVTVTVTDTGWTVRERRIGLALVFTNGEVQAFRLGAAAGEFPPALSLALAEAG